ncbi:MAG: S24/S26 family peptidase [Alistipes sp.]|nr:S24/S26 family peptidase [Alistipes sp.]
MKQILDGIEDVVGVGDTFVLCVTGYSMLPLLGYADDTIIVRRTTLGESIEGRIAMFRTKNGKIIVHRVVGIESGEVLLRGDGNIAQVERVPRESIVGVVESVRRRSGKVVSCLSQSWQRRERLWLGTPIVVRRYILALLRRWLDFKSKH